MQIVDLSAPKTPEELAGIKNTTMLVYALQALSVLWGVTAIVAVIVNYVKRDDVRGTWLDSHFSWQLRTFWWAALWIVVVVVLSTPLVLLLGLGFVTMWIGISIVGLWILYRVVRGWLALKDGRAV